MNDGVQTQADPPIYYIPTAPPPTERAEDREARIRLFKSDPTALAKYDIAEMNFLTASGLWGAENLDIRQCLATLDEWAQVVADETESWRPNFRPNPSCPTDAQYRGYMLIKVLRDKFDLKHICLPNKGTGFVGVSEKPADGQKWFEDSKPLLMHGLLGPERIGACASLAMLYAAVGRRLGYPIKLVLAASHVFNRWDGGGERFNLDGSGPDYINTHPDQYYIDTPRPWTECEKNSGYYLRSLTPSEELAICCYFRGACFNFHSYIRKAWFLITKACELAPLDPNFPGFLRTIEERLPHQDPNLDDGIVQVPESQVPPHLRYPDRPSVIDDWVWLMFQGARKDQARC
jgi:hypothetical protein